MLHQLLVTATDLDRWADLLEGKATFPELLRRLIINTSPSLISISFDSAEGIQLGGWDGLTNANQHTAFVPAGPAGWELGTNQDRKGKADDDYTKRTANPLGLTPASSTFIFCTPRRWGNKDVWENSRNAEGNWLKVKVYDANDLITWLIKAPAVHLWLSTLLHKRPAGVTDLETYWHDWSAVTTPALPAALLLAGRAETTEALHTWLTNPTKSFALVADTRKEAIATLAAAALALPQAERQAVLARAVVVESPAAWSELVTSRQPLLLIPEFRSDEAVASATRQGHHVFLALDRTDNGRSAHSPPRLDKEAAYALLKEAGVPSKRAYSLAGVARRSMSALRRHRWLDSHASTTPSWATAAHAPILLAAAFAGAWDENESQAAADKEVVASLAGLPYDQFRTQLVELSNYPEPPVRLVGSTWYVVDKADLWTLLARFHTPELIDRFTNAALQVLGTPLPRYELPANQQIWAALYGKSSPNSGRLRNEVAGTLAFLAAEEFTPNSLQSRITGAVVELLHRANTQANMWSSLARNLPELAEAAPIEFLTGVKAGLNGSTPPIMSLFEEKTGLFTPTAEHPPLLSALELLAWHPTYLPHAALVLARLARLDPGGVISNRPKNSLRELLLPWMPNTTATLPQRMSALDKIRKSEPHVAWELLIDLLPDKHTTSFETRQPIWRDWAPAHRPKEISYSVLIPATEAVIERALQDVGSSAERWELLIPNLPGLIPKQRIQAIKQLKQLDKNLFSDDQRLLLRDKLRHLIHFQRSLKRKERAMPTAEVSRLESVFHALEPADVTKRYAWLFNQWPRLLTGERVRRNTSEEEYEAKINIARQVAMDALLATGGLPIVEAMIATVESAGALGAAVGLHPDVTDAQKDALLIRYLGSDDHNEFYFGRSLAITYRNQHHEPWAWATDYIHSQQATWSPKQQAAWLDTFYDNPETWALAAELGPESEYQYWQLASPYGIKDANVTQAFAAFLQHGRPLAAVYLLRLHQNATAPADALTSALEQIMQLSAGSEPRLQVSADDLTKVIARLADDPNADSTRVARLEFSMLSLQSGKRRKAKTLNRELATNPDFFAEVLQMFTFSVDRSDPPSAEGTTAANAYRLLESWNTIPGLDRKAGIASSSQLIEWITCAFSATEIIDRAIIGAEYIGRMLSASPEGEDGIWPHEIVRDTLEAFQSEDIERGLQMGKYNSRGGTIRAAFAGGDQERAIAAQLNADADMLDFDWPRTAACLRQLAKGYTHDAEREDTDATLNQDLD
jgi:hypothetical protein